GRTPPGHARRPGTGHRTRPGPRQPPHPAPRTPDRLRAATRACPPAAAMADHAAGKGSSAAHTMISSAGPAPMQARRLCDRLTYAPLDMFRCGWKQTGCHDIRRSSSLITTARRLLTLTTATAPFFEREDSQ